MKWRQQRQQQQQRQRRTANPPQNVITRILNAKRNIITKEEEEEQRWGRGDGLVGTGGCTDNDSSPDNDNNSNTRSTCACVNSKSGDAYSTNRSRSRNRNRSSTSRSSNYIIPSFSKPNVHFLLSPRIAKDLLSQHEYSSKRNTNIIDSDVNKSTAEREEQRNNDRRDCEYVALYKPTSKARSLLQHALTNANGETWDRQRYCISRAFGPRCCRPVRGIANQVAARSIIQSLEVLLLSSLSSSSSGAASISGSSVEENGIRRKRDVSFSFIRRFFRSKDATSDDPTTTVTTSTTDRRNMTIQNQSFNSTSSKNGVTIDIREIALLVAVRTMCVAVMGKKYIGVNDDGDDYVVDVDVDQDTLEHEGKKAIPLLYNMFEPTLQPKRIGMRRNYNVGKSNNDNGKGNGASDFIQKQQRIEDELNLLVTRAVDEIQTQMVQEGNYLKSEPELIDNSRCLIHNLLTYEITNGMEGIDKQQVPVQVQRELQKEGSKEQRKQEQEGEVCPHKKYYLTREEVISNAHSALLAGTQTISTTITGALAHLASRNDLIDEIESHLQKSKAKSDKEKDGADSDSLSSSSDSCSSSSNSNSERFATVINSKDVVQEALRMLPPVAGLPRVPTACDLDFDSFDRAKDKKECPFNHQYSSHSSSPSSPRSIKICKGDEIIIDLLACAHLHERKMIIGTHDNQHHVDHSCSSFMESLQFNPKMNKGNISFAWGMGARRCPAGLLSVECISSVIDALIKEGFRWRMANEKQDGIAEDGVEKWLKESVSYLPTLTFDRPILVHFERQSSGV